MHLAVEAVGAKHSGAATVLVDFVDALLRDSRIEQLTVFASPSGLRQFEFPEDSRLLVVDQPGAEGSLAGRMWWYEKGLRAACFEHHVDGLICINGMGHAEKLAQVNLVQQSLPFCREALRTLAPHQRIRIAAIREVMRRSAHRAECILVQTPTMASWIAEQFAVSEKRIESFLPSSQLPPPRDPNNLLSEIRQIPENQRVLYVGNQSPYKQVEKLVEGITGLRRDMPEATLFLTWPLDHPYAQLPGVVCLGHLSRDVLAAAYQLATIHVLGSLVETVGLPLLEAMGAGTPVLVADRCYAHDVCADAALYFEPTQPESFAQMTSSLLGSPGLRKEYASRGRQRSRLLSSQNPYARMVDAVVETVQST